MNSFYGFYGAPLCAMPCRPVSASVTNYGRVGLMLTASEALKRGPPGTKVVYGDSVPPDTPCIVRLGPEVRIMRIDELSDGAWGRLVDKEVAHSAYEVWSDAGWTRINRVIRHHVKKDVYTVCTANSVVRVTEDHSLLTPRGVCVSPKAMVIGDPILTANVPQPTVLNNLDVDTAFLLGMFQHNGMADVLCTDDGRAVYSTRVMAVSRRDAVALLQLMQTCHPAVAFHLRTHDVQHPYFVETHDPGMHRMYTDMFAHAAQRAVPAVVLNAPRESRLSYMRSFYAASTHDPTDGKNGVAMSFEVRGAVAAASMHYVAASLDETVTVECVWDKDDTYRVCVHTPDAHIWAPSRVRELDKEAYDGVVYDLETDNHHFQAGVGRAVVHNTDSVFLLFPGLTYEESVTWGQRLAAEITTLFDAPMKLEYEKSSVKTLMCKEKKKYAMDVRILDAKGKVTAKIMVKGFVSVRRDGTRYAKMVVETGLGMALADCGSARAKAFFCNAVEQLLLRNVKLHALQSSKRINKPIVGYREGADGSARTPGWHVVLAERINRRDKAAQLGPGSRVYGVCAEGVTTGPAKYRDKVSELFEDPEYMLAHNMHYNAKYYIDSLRTEVANVCQDDPHAVRDVFEVGPHLNHVVIHRQSRGVAAMFGAAARCINCNAAVKANETMCRTCAPDRAEYERRFLVVRALALQEETDSWARCVACAGDRAESCANNSCDNKLWRRETRYAPTSPRRTCAGCSRTCTSRDPCAARPNRFESHA